ncbi:uncharacterized protein LOC105383077 [Plutella xylostella]|uniref:uncharacterized protein LOC105383077 n=1 Tax=Plutella xylostella TaxID=51655 RepID=UPI00203223C9|nr:uncharacterized protein LOC105383077 [Plutella xylostella]
MSTNSRSLRLNDCEDRLSSQSSDEKMDTGSESFLTTQDTPNSTLSSDFDEKDQESNDDDPVLRLQNPTNNDTPVLRLSEPTQECIINKNLLKQDLNDSLTTKMSNLRLDSLQVDETGDRPKHLGISPPKFSSTLTLTTSHPLMGLGSPDAVENYPDVVPKKPFKKLEDEAKDLSLSSIEDDRVTNEANSFTDFYGPQRNTSKNNLYFHENFVTADSQILNDISRIDNVTSPPDVARVQDLENSRRKIIPCFRETELKVNVTNVSTPQRVLGRVVDEHRDDSAILKYVEERKKKMGIKGESTPKRGEESLPVGIPEPEEFHSGVAEWCESPSDLRSLPNFQLPVERRSSVHQDLDSPDVLSSSTQEDRSSYQATLDVRAGSVALRHAAALPPSGTMRRRIVLPPEDSVSLDSVSACSLSSEEEPQLGDVLEAAAEDRGSSHRNSSSASDPIPEYSAAEEFEEERAWLKVPLGNGATSTCDMKVIEPFKRCLSHGGYMGTAGGAGGAAIIVFSACHLPDRARVDYHYVMDNLFLYVMWSLERLVTDEYCLVVLAGGAGGAGRGRLPAWGWLLQCYRLVDRRLRKSLKQLYLVHPTFWIKSLVLLSKPFVSSKFFKKLSYVKNLSELMRRLPVEPNAIPDLVKQYDAKR